MISIILPSHRTDTQAFMEEVENAMPAVDIQLIGCNDRDAKGKGWAVREALKHAKGELIVFLDGDGDIAPRMIRRLLPYLSDYDVIVGVKPISGLWSRRILTFLSRIYLAILFDIKVDTQTGIKLFKREALGAGDWYNNGFMFDVEILADAKKRGFRMIEVPIEANVLKPMNLPVLFQTSHTPQDLWSLGLSDKTPHLKMP
jgi:glycosyltransferase involved in cell wall biosynthesis